MVTENSGNGRQDPGFVLGGKAKIVMGGDIPDGCHRHRLHLIHLIRQQGHTPTGVHQEIAGNIRNITDHCAGGGHHTCPVTVKKDIPHGIRRNGDGIQGTVDIRQQVVKGYHGRVHTRLNRVFSGFGDGQKLDAIAKLPGKCNIQRCDL